MSTSLPSVPLEILLQIFRNLDTTDVVRLGRSCKDLYESTQNRHVWVDQVQGHIRKKPVLKLSVPDLTILSGGDLKTFAIRQERLRLRWGRLDASADFTRGGEITLPDAWLLPHSNRWLLPGGNQLLVRTREALLLSQVLFSGESPASSLLCTFGPERLGADRFLSPGVLLYTTSPHPICVCGVESSDGIKIYLFRIDFHGGEIYLETKFAAQNNPLSHASGQGRVVGCLTCVGHTTRIVTIIHLDHPGVLAQFQIPDAYFDGSNDGTTWYSWRSWSLYIPRPDLAVVYSAEHILYYQLPDFSALSPGKSVLENNPTWYMVGPLEDLDELGGPDHLLDDPIYDPSGIESFNLYFKTILGTNIVATTIIPPASTTSQVLSSPPVEERRREQVLSKLPPYASDGWRESAVVFHDGHCYRTYETERGLEYCVCSYDDLFRGDWKRTLRIPGMEEGAGVSPGDPYGWNSELSIDEASGRVVIFVGSDGGGRCYIGDLV